MAPILKFATSSGSKKKEPSYAYKKNLKVPGKGATSVFPQQGLYGERCSISRANGLFVIVTVGVPKEKPSQEMWGKHTVTVHGVPRGQKAYIQWDAAWLPKGIVNNTAVTTPVPCSLQHVTFHLGLGRPEPRYCCSSPQQDTAFTPGTASHVTQGRVGYEST
jgi:hypothetical protein